MRTSYNRYSSTTSGLSPAKLSSSFVVVVLIQSSGVKKFAVRHCGLGIPRCHLSGERSAVFEA